MPTSVISPFKGMEVSPNIREKQLRMDAPALLTPCGLAMRRFDNGARAARKLAPSASRALTAPRVNLLPHRAAKRERQKSSSGH